MISQLHRKKWHSNIVRTFWKETGGRNPIDAINRASKQLFLLLGKKEPPFQTFSRDGMEYANLLNIPVEQVDINCDGILAVINGSFLVQLRRDSLRTRKNFTLCHEIGHIEISKKAQNLSSRKIHCNINLSEHSKEEEYLVNQFASNLLMPRLVFKDYANNYSPSIDSLFELANVFCTSVAATAYRIAYLNLWPCIVHCAIPKIYASEKLGLQTVYYFHPKGLTNPLGNEKERIINTDYFHKVLWENKHSESELHYTDQLGNTRHWFFESIPYSYANNKCVLTLMNYKN